MVVYQRPLALRPRNANPWAQPHDVCAAETKLAVAADITAPTELIATYTVGEWRKRAAPDLNRRPAIFILGI